MLTFVSLNNVFANNNLQWKLDRTNAQGTIGEAHLKSPSPALARPMPIGHGWALASLIGFGHEMGAHFQQAFALGVNGQSKDEWARAPEGADTSKNLSFSSRFWPENNASCSNRAKNA